MASVTVSQILNFAWPNRGGWIVQGAAITAGDGGAVPTSAEIEAQRAAAEAHYTALSAAADADAAKDATFRATIAAGHCVSPEGYCLAMDDLDRENWAQLLVLFREAETLGAMTGESPVEFFDITGTQHTATLTRFRQMIVGLGAAYQTAFFARHSSP